MQKARVMLKPAKQPGTLLRDASLFLALFAVIGLTAPAGAERRQNTSATVLAPMVMAAGTTARDAAVRDAVDTADDFTLLSPYWGPNIQQWSDYIAILSAAYGFHPDFIASLIRHESDGAHDVVSYMGAVGLMGIMPAGPGLEWRPSSEELLTPTVNLRWGMAILSAIVRQSGGDVYAALAAYNGGWAQVNSRGPRDYAAEVLDSYARAVVVRHGLSPEIAEQWTIAIEMVAGHVPSQPLLVLGNQPLSGLFTFAEHTIYRYADEKTGRTYYIRGYAVPVALLATPAEDIDLFGPADFGAADALEVEALEEPLRARLAEKSEKMPNSDPRVLLACLPSLDRLRGHANTRWYAPSSCPSWHR
jgi:hypothetical protein